MKIVFFGTSKFAVSALKRLKGAGYSVEAVVTQPDRKGGRHLQILPSPVKNEAEKISAPIHQPHDITERSFIEKIRSYGADFFAVVGFGNILTKELLDIPKFCSLNIHASLLPKYRGAAPVRWAVANGEKATGVTIIRMNEEMDAGDIVLQKEAKIAPDETSVSLDDRLAKLGAELLIEAMELIGKGKAQFRKQDEKDVTFAPKLTKKDGRIDWNLDTASILNKVRGFSPWPGTYSSLEGRVLKVISAERAEGGRSTLNKGGFSGFSPGEVVIADEKAGIVVKTGDGAIAIKELQLEGRKQMSAELFLRGRRIVVGTKLG